MAAALSKKQLAQAKEFCSCRCAHIEVDPKVEALVTDLLGRVADKWTLLVLETLESGRVMRFSRIAEAVGGISQKMLTQTLRQMERDGLVVRTVHPVIPPHVDYELTAMGQSLGAAFCEVWEWAGDHLAKIEASRREFDARQAKRAASAATEGRPGECVALILERSWPSTRRL